MMNLTRWKRTIALLLTASMLFGNDVCAYADSPVTNVSEETAVTETPVSTLDGEETAVGAEAAVEADGTVVPKLSVYGVDEEVVEGVDYQFQTITQNSISLSKLTILSDKKMEIRGDGDISTTDCIVFGAKDRDNDIHVILSEVRLNNLLAKFTPAQIYDNYKGNVYLTLQYENFLRAGGNHAGLQKNGGVETGTLTIDGDGTLRLYGADASGDA